MTSNSKNQKPTSQPPSHFKDKDALGHVIEAQAQGIMAASEVHGVETPGHLSAAFDAARETAVLLTLIWITALFFMPTLNLNALLIVFSCSLLLWKAGRSAWIGWFRLERLHRMLEQERFEIEHHRQQERDELRVLYAAKGFEGKLLEEVLDVLMADNDRLLKVMVEEELGLSLGAYEHPLKQGLGAAIGVLISSIICLIGYIVAPEIGLAIGAALALGLAAAGFAYFAQNHLIPAVIWNLGLGILSCGCLYSLLQFLHT